MPTINPYLTAGGLAAAVSAAGSGLQLSITHISLGAGQYTPALNGSGNATQTAMVDRREKMTLGAGSLIPPVQVTMGTVFPVYTGSAYNVGELGFWAGDPDAGGVLFAIYSAPGYVHALRNSTLELVESYSLAVAQVPAGSVTVTVDPGVANINNTMAAHLAVTDPHVAYLKKASNLSELASASTARTNLGLGSSATHPSTDFDAAGSAAAVLASSLQKASNLSDLASASTARTNLGLGSAAVQATSAFDAAGAAAAAQSAAVTSSLQKSANLSDVANVATARNSLGLGLVSTAGTNGSESRPTGIIENWGYIAPQAVGASNVNDVAVTFTTPFPTACDNIVLSKIGQNGGASGTSVCVKFSGGVPVMSTTGATIQLENNDTAITLTFGAFWRALGH